MDGPRRVHVMASALSQLPQMSGGYPIVDTTGTIMCSRLALNPDISVIEPPVN